MRGKRRKPVVLLSVLFVLTVCIAFFYMSGLRCNVTSSLPGFLWLIRSIEHGEPIRKGDFVVASPSEIASGKGYEEYILKTYFGRFDFLKQVSGVSGDRIVKDFELLSLDNNGYQLPVYPLPVILGADEYWLTSDRERGFDSRYFGPVNRRTIRAKAKLLF